LFPPRVTWLSCSTSELIAEAAAARRKRREADRSRRAACRRDNAQWRREKQKRALAKAARKRSAAPHSGGALEVPKAVSDPPGRGQCAWPAP
jgi:hypothetical protein